MIVLVSFSHPAEIEKEDYSHILNLRQTPDFIDLKGPCISSKIGGLFRYMCIYEVRQKRLSDAFKYFDKKAGLLEKFPGFVYEFRQISKLEGALKLIGGL
jgi:hypothetical protein